MMIERRLTQLLILVTFALLALGGYVHNTESSLACPDWPLCYGQFFPTMEGGVLIEHSHRLLASLTGFLTILLVFFTRKKYKTTDKKLVNITYAALVMVIVQGILGGITVIYKLPTIVSTTHLGLSQIYFLTLIYINHCFLEKRHRFVTSEKAIGRIRNTWRPSLRDGLLIGTIFIYLQMILGAFMRHAGVGAACGVGFNNAIRCLDTTTWQLTWWPEASASQLHMAHRFFAIVTAFVVVIFCLKSIKYFIHNLVRNDGWPLSQIYWGLCPIFFIFIQIGIGIWTVGTGLSILPTTLHLVFAVFALAFMFKYYLNFRSIEKEVFSEKPHTLVGNLFELTKPKLTFLSVTTALLGLIIAPEHVNFFYGLLAVICITMVVAGACGLNCYLERDIDTLMERTKKRALPAGRLNPKFALIFSVSLIIIGTVILAVKINTLTAGIGLVATALYLYAYTPMKQKSPLAVYIGAIPGALPPVMGWTAVTSEINLMAVILFAILFIWQVPHFYAISIYCAQDYQAAHIQILPTQKGFHTTKLQIVFYSIVLFAVSLVPIFITQVTGLYKVSSVVLGALLIIAALLGLKTGDDFLKNSDWAKKYFWVTLVYLPLLFFSLILF